MGEAVAFTASPVASGGIGGGKEDVHVTLLELVSVTKEKTYASV